MKISKIYIRRGLLLLLVMFTAAFQHTDGAVPVLFGTKAMLLIPLAVAIGMYERSMSGLVFGTLAGVLWDFAAVRGDGFFSVCLAAVGFFSGVLVTWYLRNCILSALLLGAVSITGVNVIYWYIFIFSKGYEGATELLTGYYLPSVLYTLIFIFVYYYIVGFIVKLTTDKKKAF